MSKPDAEPAAVEDRHGPRLAEPAVAKPAAVEDRHRRLAEPAVAKPRVTEPPVALWRDSLFRLGTSVPAESLTWVPVGRSGYDPQNAYLLVTPDEALFVDCGPALIEPEIATALAELVGERTVAVFPTRNQAECIGNLGYLLAEGRDAKLPFGGGGGILEWVGDPDLGPLETASFAARVPVVAAANGSSLCVGEFELHFLDAPVKQMMLTQWVYESTSRTLFTSDFFAWVRQEASDDPVVSTGGALSVEEVAEDIACEVNWLRGARCPAVIEALRHTFSEQEVETIAPVHGCVLHGREAVADQVELAIEALDLLTT